MSYINSDVHTGSLPTKLANNDNGKRNDSEKNNQDNICTIYWYSIFSLMICEAVTAMTNIFLQILYMLYIHIIMLHKSTDNSLVKTSLSVKLNILRKSAYLKAQKFLIKVRNKVLEGV